MIQLNTTMSQETAGFVPRIRKKTRGFTLIEILIVVVILGILAAIVVPQFTNATEQAEETAAHSQLNVLRGQVSLYFAKHGTVSPLGQDINLVHDSPAMVRHLVRQAARRWRMGVIEDVHPSLMEGRGRHGPFVQLVLRLLNDRHSVGWGLLYLAPIPLMQENVFSTQSWLTWQVRR